MNVPHFAAKRLLHSLAILNVLLMVPAVFGQAAATPTAQPGPAPKPESTTKPAAEEAAPLGKRERKAQKRERQREAMLKRIEERGKSGPVTKTAPPPAPANAPNPYQAVEDFDRNVNWEQKDNRSGKSDGGYGYSSTNHLAPAGCAPGEIGGSVSDNGISWFAENVARGSALLDVDAPLRASGWCVFTATQGAASVGWFNSETYAAPDVAPHAFIGWRQDGNGICASLGHTGSSFLTGPPLPVANDKPFQWTLSYTPTGGSSRCGEAVLTVGGATSALSLSKEQRAALAANKFNRFGIVTARTGSQTSTLWLDNLAYTKVSGFPVPNLAATAHTRTEFFDADPAGSTFLAVNNMSPHEPVTVIQDYGYQTSGGRSGGCIGGRFTPAIGSSYYGYDYGSKPLHFSDKLRSEGWFQVPSFEGRCMHFGWTSKHGMSWHEPNTLALRISSIHIKGKGQFLNIAAEGTLNYEGHGGAGWGTITTIPAGPEWHHYVMEFDPAGGYGLGTFTCEIDGTSKVFYFGEDKLSKGGDIEIFGMWNAKLPAEDKTMTAYLDDVTNTTNGKPDPASSDFNSPPSGWVGRNNSFKAKDSIVRPYHQFGWAGALPNLDGANGYSSMYTIPESERHCMGGIIYLASFFNLNVPRASYGAGLNGTLNTRDHHLYATGRFKIDWANVDAGELVGWYNSATACDEVTEGKGHGLPNKFLGVVVAAGSNGYGMIPCYRSPLEAEEQTFTGSSPRKRAPDAGDSDLSRRDRQVDVWNTSTRVYEDGQWREFYMEYDPDGAAGRGQFKLQLGKDSPPVTFDLNEGAKGADFAFDRFGLLTHRKGGGKPHAIYFDKLTYTVAP